MLPGVGDSQFGDCDEISQSAPWDNMTNEMRLPCCGSFLSGFVRPLRSAGGLSPGCGHGPNCPFVVAAAALVVAEAPWSAFGGLSAPLLSALRSFALHPLIQPRADF